MSKVVQNLKNLVFELYEILVITIVLVSVHLGEQFSLAFKAVVALVAPYLSVYRIESKTVVLVGLKVLEHTLIRCLSRAG